MAVNDNMIELVAKLNEKDSIAQINNDIKTIAGEIKPLQIKCAIDDNSIKDIKSQLSNIKINVGATVQPTAIKSNPVVESEVKINATSVKDQIKELSGVLNSNIGNGADAVLQGLVDKLAQLNDGATIWTNWSRKANGALSSFSISLKNTTGEVTKYNYAVNQLGNVKALGSKGTDKDIAKVNQEVVRLRKELANFESSHSAIKSGLTEPIKQAHEELEKFNTNEGSIERLKIAIDSLKTSAAEIGANLNSEDKSNNKFTNAINKAQNFDNVIKSLTVDVEKLWNKDNKSTFLSQLDTAKTKLGELKKIESESGTGLKWSESYKELNALLQDISNNIRLVKKIEAQDNSSAAQKTLDSLNRIKDAYKAIEKYTVKVSNPNTSKEEKATANAYILNYQKRIKATKESLDQEGLLTKEVKKRIAEYKQELIEVQNNAKARAAGINNKNNETARLKEQQAILSNIKNAYSQINTIEGKSVNTVGNIQNIYSQDITRLQSIIDLSRDELKTKGLLTKEVEQQIADYERQLTVQREIRNAQIMDYSTLNKNILSKVNALNSQINYTGFVKNANMPDVQAQITQINALKTAYETLLADLAKAQTPEAVKSVITAFNQLSPKFDEVNSKTKQLQASMRGNQAFERQSIQIRNLTVDMENFAKSNANAINSTKLMSNGKSFADNWVEMNKQMALGAQLTETELINLKAAFRNFGKEAESAGLRGVSVFKKLKSAFSFLAPYFSSYRIISTVISNIRSAITELKNLDDILTEIAKVSDRTKENLTELSQNAFDVASKYGRTASDYLTGVQEMSRAGFAGKQAEQLAELSLRAQAAGYMTAEMANEYIVATNAGYELQGSIEKLNQVLDGQVYVTDRNALNMENLAEATKMAASQASSAGIGIDELTAAVGTMISVTQQGGSQAGRAFRGKRAISTNARYRRKSIIA